MKTLAKIIKGLTAEFTRWIQERLTGELGVRIHFNQGGVTRWYVTTNKQGEK